ncbi:MAG TPA: TerC family protein [Fibrobacteria bacterium]|jgi:YjbE family integral membrane protein|nr:TerC family protein [Fibrobacteria bacterium]
MEFGFNAQFLGALLSIVLIDIVLSGDNSIVIALAVRSLPPRKRTWGIVLGAGSAAILRILFTTVASKLMGVPFVKLLGGFLILWIALKLLGENTEHDSEAREARSVWRAVWMILVADVTMSLDNVLGVAGAAQGHLGLLWFGLFLSIPLVVFASSMLSKLMGRFPVIILLGAAVLGKVGGEMIAGDPLLHRIWPSIAHLDRGFELAGIALVIGYWFWLRRKRAQAAA